jgi:hypothetical protein
MVTNDAEEFQKAIDMTDEQLDAAIARAERLLGEAQREEAKKSRIATSITQRRVTL